MPSLHLSPRMRTARMGWVPLLIALLTTFLPVGRAAAEPAVDEAAVKAAFVYNFIKLVDWPSEAWNRVERIQICLAGPANGFAAALAELAHKPSVQGKQLEVRSLSRPADGASCQVLVMTAPDHSVIDWLRSIRTLPVLSVGEGEGFAASGGDIGLYLEGNRLRFEINIEAAKRSSLRPSSQLLKLARLVGDGGVGVHP